jgi:hypothetical protein
MTNKPSRRQIVESLQNGDRDPVDDADRVDSESGLQAVELVHLACNGSVTLHYNYYTAYEGTEAGGVYEFNIMEEYDGGE